MRIPVVAGLLIISGALWAPWYFGMGLVGWGEPGSTAYQRYELYNRLAPLVLLVLACAIWSAGQLLGALQSRAGRWGTGVASLGLAVMAFGSVWEFWLFSDAAYASGSLRGRGWFMYCVGLAVFYAGSAMLGWTLWRLRAFRLAGILIGTWLPLAAAVAGVNGLAGTALPALSIAVLVCGVGYVLLGVGAMGTVAPSPPSAPAG